MVLLFDGTDSVTNIQMQSMKRLIHNLILGYNTGVTSSKIGLGVYGKSLRGNGYYTNKLLFNKVELTDYLAGMKQVGGLRHLGAALEFSINRFGGLQFGSKKVFILFVTGNNQIFDMLKFESAAQLIRSTGHELYIVALGNRIEVSQYVGVVGDAYVYHVLNVNALPDRLNRLLILNVPIEGRFLFFLSGISFWLAGKMS